MSFHHCQEHQLIPSMFPEAILTWVLPHWFQKLDAHIVFHYKSCGEHDKWFMDNYVSWEL